MGRFRVGPRSAVVVNRPDLAVAVLRDHAEQVEKGPLLTRHARVFMGDGLVTCPQAAHAAARAGVQPAFTPTRLAAYLPIMLEETECAAAALTPGDVVDVHAWLSRLAMRIIGRALFGGGNPSDSLPFSAAEAALESAVHVGLHYINHRIRHPLGAPLWWPTELNRRARQARHTLHTLVDGWVAQRGTAPGDDILGHLAPSLSPLARRDHLVTLLLAGFETVAAHLAWTVALLAEHPDVEAEFLNEINVLPATPTVADLDGLAFTQAVLNESLRLYPPAHTLGRVTRAPIEVGGHVLPAGTVLIVSPWLLHRRPDTFPDPERFDPRRPPAPRHALIPFSLGPRVCIGGRFATLEALAVLAVLGRRLRFVPLTPGRPQAETLLTLRPHGFVARIERV